MKLGMHDGWSFGRPLSASTVVEISRRILGKQMHIRMNIGVTLLLAVVSFAITSSNALASQTLDRINATGTLVVATDPAWPPFSWRDANGAWFGFDVDVGTEMAKRLGLKASFSDPAWDQLVAGNWNGAADVCVCSMTPTAERAKNLDFPAVYYWAPVNLAVNKSNTTAMLPGDLSGKRIGVLVPSTYELYLRRIPMDVEGMPPVQYKIDNPAIVGYEAESEVFDAMTSGTDIDAMIGYLPVLMDEISKGRPLRVIGSPLFYVSNAIAVEKGDPEFSKEIGRVTEEMLGDGTIRDISMKWFQFDFSRTQ